MRITKTGIALTIIYLTGLIVCVVWAQFIDDPKGKYVILQLPVVLQHGLLLSVNATHMLSGLSWFSIYIVLGVPMVFALMLLGQILELVAAKLILCGKTLNKRL